MPELRGPGPTGGTNGEIPCGGYEGNPGICNNAIIHMYCKLNMQEFILPAKCLGS